MRHYSFIGLDQYDDTQLHWRLIAWQQRPLTPKYRLLCGFDVLFLCRADFSRSRLLMS